jgi:hypothetical protein
LKNVVVTCSNLAACRAVPRADRSSARRAKQMAIGLIVLALHRRERGVLKDVNRRRSRWSATRDEFVSRPLS